MELARLFYILARIYILFRFGSNMENQILFIRKPLLIRTSLIF